MVKKNIRPTAGRGGMQPTYTTASIHAKPRSKNSKTNTCTTFERNPATARRRNRPPPGLHGRRDGAARETAEPKAQTERVRERARQDGVRDDRRPHRRVHHLPEMRPHARKKNRGRERDDLPELQRERGLPGIHARRALVQRGRGVCEQHLQAPKPHAGNG